MRRSADRLGKWGCALLPLSILLFSFLAPAAAQAEFGFDDLDVAFTEADGTPATQAGSHPFAWATDLTLNTTGPPGEEVPDGALKDLRIQLPPGLIGTPALLPRCGHEDFRAATCPSASQVGSIGLHTDLPGTKGEEFPVYNLEPLPGNAAELAFTVLGVPVTIELTIGVARPHNLIASITNASQAGLFYGSLLTIRGVPGAAPLLTLPRSCAPATTIFEATAWAAPAAWVISQPASPAQITGCENLPFAPTLSAGPTTDAAGAPSGFDLSLEAPDQSFTTTAAAAAHADLRSASLILPPEMTINPSLAFGLAACTPADLARETPSSHFGEGCAPAAKIGTAEVITPLLDRPVGGSIFLAEPDDPSTHLPGAENPFDSRFSLYIVFKDVDRGVLVTQPVRIEADPRSGRLTATTDEIPALPFSHLELHLHGGPFAPLITPQACATHSADYALTPSSGAGPLSGRIDLPVPRGCAGPSFNPALSAGTLTPRAGAGSPFIFELTSGELEESTSHLSLTLPPGLSADFSTAAICPEPLTATATCPPGSRLGSARIALGPGSEPLWIPEAGKTPSGVYLAGPYKGAAYSLLISVPAEAGPFDFGIVIIRATLHIDSNTAQASVRLDPLPQVLAGVPLHYRRVRLILDRPGFIHNPTSCKPTRVAATATSATGASAELSDHFQVADCAALGLKPKLSFRLSGGLGRNAHPTVTVGLGTRPADANLRAATLSMPYGLFIDPARLGQSCTRMRFAADDCPRSARLGWAEVRSPLLPGPERGRVFLLEGDRRLPDLAVSIGGRVPLDLHGHLDARHTRIQAGFDSLPDIPLSHLRLVLKGGFRGLLVNSNGLCGEGVPLFRAAFVGHNSKQRRIRSRAELRCPR